MSKFSNNYGLNPDFNYYEFSFDSNDAQRPFNYAGVSSKDWPVFFLGGKRDLTNIAAIKILEVQVPYSYYVFNAITPPNFSNGHCLYTDNLGSTSFDIVGNYTRSEFITKLTTLLNAAHVFLGGNNNAFTVSFDQALGKFTILASDPVTGLFQFSLNFNIENGSQLVGLNPGVNTSTAFGLLLFPNVPLLSGPNYLYLNSQTIGTLVNLYLPTTEANSGGNAGPQIAKIPVNTDPYGIIYWQDPDPQKWFDVENLNQLQQIDFYFTTGDSQKVTNFNGLSFSIKFGVLLNKETKTQNEADSFVKLMGARGRSMF